MRSRGRHSWLVWAVLGLLMVGHDHVLDKTSQDYNKRRRTTGPTGNTKTRERILEEQVRVNLSCLSSLLFCLCLNNLLYDALVSRNLLSRCQKKPKRRQALLRLSDTLEGWWRHIIIIQSFPVILLLNLTLACMAVPSSISLLYLSHQSYFLLSYSQTDFYILQVRSVTVRRHTRHIETLRHHPKSSPSLLPHLSLPLTFSTTPVMPRCQFPCFPFPLFCVYLPFCMPINFWVLNVFTFKRLQKI